MAEVHKLMVDELDLAGALRLALERLRELEPIAAAARDWVRDETPQNRASLRAAVLRDNARAERGLQ